MPSIQFQQVTKDHALRVARHEFGHWLAAEHFGFKPHDIRIIMTDFVDGYTGASDVTLEQDLSSLEKVASFASRRTIMLLCGATAAGKVDQAKASNELSGKKGRAKDDWRSVRELLRVLRGIRHPLTNDDSYQAETDALLTEH